MPDPDRPSPEALLGELQTLERLIPTAPAGTGLMALIRLLDSGASWPQLLEQHHLTHWLAVPLDQDAFPALTALREQLDALNFQKDHDSLTGLRNRRAFDRELALEVERAGRFKAALSLCLLDLDNFKRINDAHGHPCGDSVIRAMADILRDSTRKIDIAARVGGEEFALILPGTGLLRSQKLLERILESVRAARVACDTTTIAFTCSMGLASYRGKQAPDAQRLYAEADKALYRAKHDGKNRIEAAPLLDLKPIEDQTLVQQNEKRFLFSTLFAASGDTTSSS